jgi:hypothetical protein
MLQKYYSLIIGFCCTVFVHFNTYIFSQVCENCNPKEITTNFTSPKNTEKPTKKNTFFDWTNLGSLSVFAQYFPAPYDNIASPFHQDNNAPLAHFFDNPDRLSKDGWELIKYNLGYLENGSANGFANRDIYIVLYNKYTAILRVFVASNESIGFNGLRVTMQFNYGTQSSLLSNASEIFALDTFKPNPSITGIVGYRPGLWSYADFSLTYDPCTCKNESRIAITIDYINTLTIKLNGAVDGSIVSTDGNSKLTNVNQDGYSFANLVDGAKKAKKTYDDLDGFVKDQFNAIDIVGKTNLQVKAEALFRKNSINDFQKEIKKSNFLKAGLKTLPYIGAALDLLDFFIGGGRESSGPQEVRIMPMALQADVTLSGEIIGSYPYPDIVFNTPGSKNVPCKDDTQYPYYNEVLGVFNLLETPKIISNNLENTQYYDNGTGYYYERILDAYQAAPIKYVINPAAGFRTDNVEIMASLDFGSFKTSYVPLSAITSFSIEAGHIASLDQYSNGSPNYSVLGCTDNQPVALRLLVNLERLNSTADTQDVLIAIKYPLQFIDNSSFVFAPKYCDAIPNINLDKISLVNQTINYDIFSWQEITIGPNVTFVGNRILRAPNVTILSGGAIPPNVSVQSMLPNGHIPFQIPPVAQSEINSFCASNTYNVQSRTVRKATEVEVENYSAFDVDKLLTAYPNPTSGKVSFRYYIEEPSQVRLNLVSTTGTVVATPVDAYQEAGPYEFNYDASHLPAGIYIYTLETSKEKETRRLVIIK